MKNIVNIEGKLNFTCGTPYGGDSVTCPLCGNNDLFYNIGYNSKKYNEYFQKYKYFYQPDKEDIIGHYELEYCDKCNIIYDIGCIRSCYGCTSDIYNGHLVKKWKYENNVYYGMPIFDNVEEYLEKIKDIEILEMVCPNNGIQTGGSYPKETYPNYYTDCELKK